MSITDRLLGRRLASSEEGEQRVGPVAGIPMLGLDALASAAYGPEAALTVLLPLGALGLGYVGPISFAIIGLLVVVYFSYRQTIAAYPNGGGSYTVARANLGERAGFLAAAALMLDYVLVVAVGISAGVGALVSALPSLQPFTLALCLAALAMVTLVNLRGVKESGAAFMVPTYAFVVTLLIVLAIGLAKTVLSGGHPVPVDAPAPLEPAAGAAGLWLVLRAFASGCTAMTGVEAVSNGVAAFRTPTVLNARRTLSAIIVILVVLLAGIAVLAGAYRVGATEPGTAGYESMISQLIGAVVGKGPFYYVTIASVIAVLALSANTGFADFPRLCRVVAQDDALPHAFAERGRRLAFSAGILTIATLSGGLLVVFGGVTDRLIPLFAVGAFLAFTLSQAGMVEHWRRVGGPGARLPMLVNGFGALVTGLTLAVVLVAKFTEGAWITLVLVPAGLVLFGRVRAHYRSVARRTALARPLDLTDLQPPIVVVPVKGWDVIAAKALRFALKLSPDVHALHVRVSEEGDELEDRWEELVAAPARAAGKTPPRLVVLPSPYRALFGPLLGYIAGLEKRYPGRQIAVIVPELVEDRPWHYLLHNQRATALKTLLLFRGDRRIVVVNVPWYLGE